MSKRSAHRRARKAEEQARIEEVERAWRGSLTPDVAAAFEAQVKVARARGPLPPPPDMPPGTPPRPPRPGHEPKPPKTDERQRRGSR
jgi:hypothetical protein